MILYRKKIKLITLEKKVNWKSFQYLPKNDKENFMYVTLATTQTNFHPVLESISDRQLDKQKNFSKIKILIN